MGRWGDGENIRPLAKVEFTPLNPPLSRGEKLEILPPPLAKGRAGEGSFMDFCKRSILNPKSKIQNLKSKIAFSYLLPAGEVALQSWQSAWNQGSRTFKWKIGVAAIADELKVFNQLIQILPPSAKLRLDANGGLTQQETHQWLKAADEAGIVEFLEQPLPPGQFDAMLEIRTRYSTPIALDESVATLTQLEECYQRGWQGVFVIKAAIAGSPKRLRQLCQDYNIDAVFSSVFESAIARQAALQLAAELSNPNRAVGFGVNHWFNDDDETWLEHLWKTH
jgi:o-succinylbenzoate synthase